MGSIPTKCLEFYAKLTEITVLFEYQILGFAKKGFIICSCITEIQNEQVILTQPQQVLNTTLKDISANLRRLSDAREGRKLQRHGKTTLLLFKPQLQECLFHT